MTLDKRLLAFRAMIVAVLVALDQAVKALVEQHMLYHEQIDLLPFFALFRTHNDGIAFSLLSGVGVPGLVALTLFILTLVLWLAARTLPHQKVARAGFILIVAGAIGNLIDRAALGYVIDYFLFHTPSWSFAIFNLADSFITIGAGLVLVDEFLIRAPETHDPEKHAPEAPASDKGAGDDAN